MSTTKPSHQNDQAFISMMNTIKGASSSQGDKAQGGDIAAMLGSIKLTLNSHQRRKLAHNKGMDTKNHPSHRELDAKLETIETRMDGRLARIEDSIRRITEDGAATRENISSLKTTIVVTAIGAALTVLFGIAAFNATLLSNMTSSFDSGRDTEKAASEAKAEISSSVAEIKQMVQEMKQQQEEIKP